MKYDEVARRVVLIDDGGTQRAARSVSIPDWGPKDLKEGTLRGILKGLELDWDEFMRTK